MELLMLGKNLQCHQILLQILVGGWELCPGVCALGFAKMQLLNPFWSLRATLRGQNSLMPQTLFFWLNFGGKKSKFEPKILPFSSSQQLLWALWVPTGGAKFDLRTPK